MTDVDISLCVRVVGELFGPMSSKICYYLLKEGELTLALIRKLTSFTPEEIRRSLCVLLHNRIISVIPGKITAYMCQSQSALAFCFYKYYIALVKKIYGDICELVVEELLFMGQMTYFQCVERTVKRYNAVVEPDEALSIEKVKDKFTVLLREGIIVQVVGNNSGGVIEQSSNQQSQTGLSSQTATEDTPSIDTIFEQTARRKRFRRGGAGLDNEKEAENENSLKRVRVEDPDIGLYYGVNHVLLARLFAEDILIRLANDFFDPGAGRVLSAMFRIVRKRTKQTPDPQPGWAGLSSVAMFIDDVAASKIPLTPSDVVREVNVKSVSASAVSSSQQEMALVTVQQYLGLLSCKTSPVKFITKIGENSFGCDMQLAFKGICQRSVENVIEYRFGVKSLRIFRMIFLNDFCDQKQMEQTVLMPVKECRERLYTLMINGFVVVREGVSVGGAAAGATNAGPRFGTGRSGAASAHTVEMDRVCRMLLEWTKKAMLNCIVRREFEVASNKRVIDREKRVLDLLAAMEEGEHSAEDKAALEEMLPPAERQLAAAIRKSVFKLENSESQLVESLFVFETATRLYKNHHF